MKCFKNHYRLKVFMAFCFIVSCIFAGVEPPTVEAATLPAIASGGYHTVYLKSDGTVWTWGYNSSGQLGDIPNNPYPYAPMQVNNLSGVSAIAAGSSHTVVLKSDGSVWAWGSNSSGQLGDGTKTNSSVPLQVKDTSDSSGFLSKVSAIAAGSGYTIALKSDGTVLAWGYNDKGQLGNGTTTDKNVPAPVTGLTGISKIVAGYNHSLALRKSDGTVWTWGANDYNKLGNGTPVNTPCTSPVQVAGLTGVSAIAASDSHTVALKNDGSVWAWGYNSSGQLGDGTTTTRSTPVQATGLTALGVVSAIAAGSSYTVAIKQADNTVWSWGYNGSSGCLGNDSTEDSKFPVQATGLTGISAIAARSSYTVALTNQETIISWGYNNYGQLGIGNIINSRVPVQANFSLAKPSVDTLPAVSVTANYATLNGEINPKGVATAYYYFEYGTTNTYGSKTSSRSAGLETSYTQVMSNLVDLIPDTTYHFRLVGTNCAGKSEGLDQTFTTTSSVSTTPVSDSYSVTPVIVSGNVHTIYLKGDGTVWTWGCNDYGQLGDGTSTNKSTPVQVKNLSGVSAIAAAGSYTVAVKSDGTVWAWGSNGSGRLGSESTIYSNAYVPIQVNNLSNITAIAAGDSHVVALARDGSLWAWGYNEYGRLGNGTTIDGSSVPIQVRDISNVSAIAAAGSYTVALKSDGSVWTWGYNEYGQLGNATPLRSYSAVPLQVTGISGVVSKIAASASHVLAMKNDGSVLWAWGSNDYGQLGDGTTTTRTTPVPVTGLTGTVSKIAAGNSYSIIINNDGSVWAWGSNGSGQFGDGTTTNSKTPLQVPSLTNMFSTITARGSYTAALKNDGSVSAWGYNNYGQLGNGTTTNSPAPVQAVVPSVSAPTVTTGLANTITDKSATLTGTVNARGVITNCFFEYSTSSGYGSSSTIKIPASPSSVSGANSTSVTANITGLTYNKFYYFRLYTEDSSGTRTNYGSSQTFRTRPDINIPPTVNTSSANVTSDSAVLNGSINPNGYNTECYFEFGNTAAYNNTIEAVPSQIIGTSSSTSVAAYFRLTNPATIVHVLP